MATTIALFSGAPGFTFPDTSSLALATIDVSTFSQIRIVANNRAGSAGTVTILLTSLGPLGAQLDTLTLTPGSQVTAAYAVPGMTLTIDAQGSGMAADDTVDVLIYGN